MESSKGKSTELNQSLCLITLCVMIAFLAGFAACNSGSDSKSDSVTDPQESDEVRITTETVVTGLNRPVHITSALDGSGRLFIVEQAGIIRILKNSVLQAQPFLDIAERVSCCGEQGLLGLAFPPGYAEKRYFYVNYTDVSDNSVNTVIARFHVPAQSPDKADPNSEEILLTVQQPYSNHNGGQIAFGPDGYLYIGMGDGGSGGDPENYAQNPGTLLGKMLRIDVESGVTPYAIPTDNPFISDPSYKPEIWATGLRNPWRFSFDRVSGDLFIADVGQNEYEEIDFQSSQSKGGENYGWKIMEGNHCYNSDTCDQAGLIIPVAEYDHSVGCSVTGGMVYRGSTYPDLAGIYFYGDYCTGRIWGLEQTADQWQSKELLDTQFWISTFGEDEEGNIYVADYATGDILRIVQAP